MSGNRLRILATALSIPAFFLFLCLTVFLYMSPEEKYSIRKRIEYGLTDKALEEKALARRNRYLKRTILLDDKTAGVYVDFQKGHGEDKDGHLAKRLQDALKNHPRPGLVREFEEISSQLDRLRK